MGLWNIKTEIAMSEKIISNLLIQRLRWMEKITITDLLEIMARVSEEKVHIVKSITAKQMKIQLISAEKVLSRNVLAGVKISAIGVVFTVCFIMISSWDHG